MKLRYGLLIFVFSIFAVYPSVMYAEEWTNPHLLLTPDQVEKKINKSNWVVVDCRPLSGYLTGHIPGAISFGKECSSALRDATSRAYRNPEVYEKLLGMVGISNGTHVVFYHGDVRTLTSATVGFWIMEYLGQANKAHLLNGGLEAWKAAGKKLDKKPAIKKPVVFKANIDHARIAETDEIVKIAKGEITDVQLVDSRTEAEFKGKDMKALRAGHVPNVTLNVPHIDTLVKKKIGNREVPTGYLSPDIVAEVFKSLDKEKRTISQCQTGTRSTLTYLEFRLLGFKNPANWDESWRVYGSHPAGFPIEDEQYFDFTRIRSLEGRIRWLEKKLSAR